jgi:FAD binding domain
MATLRRPAVEELRENFRGEVIRRGDLQYEHARSVYNAMVDRKPELILRCRDVADVITAVQYGRESGLPIAVRGGSHSVAGFASVDEGLVIDLRNMNGVLVDPDRRQATVQGGALVGDLDHATHVFGLATPTGTVSTTGIGGLMLGGGHGYLSRQYGLTIDNLDSADVVLADGRFVRASEDDHEELFWALRGGGGNFGVVTAFTLRLHPVETVIGGPVLWSLDAAGDILRWYREFLPSAREDLSGFFAFLTVPPAPPFPLSLHLEKMCGIVWCFTGPGDEAADAFAPMLAAVDEPAFNGVHAMPYPLLQRAFDALLPAGDQHYWRGDFVRELPDEAIAEHVRFASRLPTPQSAMHLYPIDGAVHRTAPGDTAFAHRDANWSQVMFGIDPDPARNELLRSWTGAYWEAIHPYTERAA